MPFWAYTAIQILRLMIFGKTLSSLLRNEIFTSSPIITFFRVIRNHYIRVLYNSPFFKFILYTIFPFWFIDVTQIINFLDIIKRKSNLPFLIIKIWCPPVLQKLIKVFLYSWVYRYFLALPLTCTFHVPIFTALHAFKILHLSLWVISLPHFQAPLFLMSIHQTLIALNDIALGTLIRNMSPLVAFKAQFRITIKGIMRVFTAQNAI